MNGIRILASVGTINYISHCYPLFAVMQSGVCVGRLEQHGNPEQSGGGAEVLGECPGECDGWTWGWSTGMYWNCLKTAKYTFSPPRGAWGISTDHRKLTWLLSSSSLNVWEWVKSSMGKLYHNQMIRWLNYSWKVVWLSKELISTLKNHMLVIVILLMQSGTTFAWINQPLWCYETTCGLLLYGYD